LNAAAAGGDLAGPEAPAPVSDGAVLALLGPTASGKSALALEVARTRSATGRPTEIVAIDAFTVYRGMDVATAKPGRDERAAVPHHLVDVLDPSEELTVVRFRMLARAAIAEVHARGATALLVGGSGLYWRAVVDDLSFPPTDPEVRASIEARFDGDAAAAHAALAAVDARAAEDIGARNLRRIIRALEVVRLTGRPFSSWDDAWRSYDAVYADLSVAYLEPPAEELRAAIADRAQRMVAGGLLAEVEVLRGRPRSRTAAAAIGYAEAEAVLDGRAPLDDLARTIAERTWRYARRQRSWFRADPRCSVTEPADVLSAWA
jgi:tRNA dimethylallyltransferase